MTSRGNELRLALAGALVASLALGCGTGRTDTWKASTTTATPVAAPADANPGADGDALWAQRGDESKLRAANAAWETALAASPENGELLVKLARGHYLLADAYLRGDAKKEEYLATFTKGVDYAERALTVLSPAFKAKVLAGERVEDALTVVEPAGVPALYWYASNLGKWAKAKGFATTLGNKDRIKGVMTRCQELDPTYFYGGPDRYFGAFYAVAPSFAGGDLNKSEEHFKKSLEIAPNYIATKVLMAENLAVKRQDKELFVKLLNEVIAAPDDILPELMAETQFEKAKAKELLAQVNEKF